MNEEGLLINRVNTSENALIEITEVRKKTEVRENKKEIIRNDFTSK